MTDLNGSAPSRAPWAVPGYLTLLVGLIAAGCGPARMIRCHPRFSPDSRVLAYIEQEEKDPALRCNICWRDVSEAGEVSRIRVDAPGPSWDDLPLGRRIHLVFSPDSRRLAAVTPTGIRIIELSSAETHSPTARGEVVTGLAWVSNDEIVYAAHTNRKGTHKEVSDRTFWRQKVASPAKDRQAVYREARTATGVGYYPLWPLEHLSPDGRFVVFASPFVNGKFKLLDLRTKAVREVGRCDGYAACVAWKRDGSAAFCVGGAWPPQAVLVEPATGKITDFSRRFAAAFGQYPPRLAALWTGDGKYFVVNHVRRRGCLVGVRPWEVKEIGRWFVERTDARGGPSGFIEPLAVPGWVFVHGKKVLKDYMGWHRSSVETMALYRFGEHGLAISPDGKKAALADFVTGEGYTMFVRDLKLPPPK